MCGGHIHVITVGRIGILDRRKQTVFGHYRLLRSLSFGDDDYGSCVFDVVKSLVQADPANLGVIADFIQLSGWLKENDPRLFDELYGHSTPPAG